jgi:hypothetical protein
MSRSFRRPTISEQRSGIHHLEEKWPVIAPCAVDGGRYNAITEECRGGAVSADLVESNMPVQESRQRR